MMIRDMGLRGVEKSLLGCEPLVRTVIMDCEFHSV